MMKKNILLSLAAMVVASTVIGGNAKVEAAEVPALLSVAYEEPCDVWEGYITRYVYGANPAEGLRKMYVQKTGVGKFNDKVVFSADRKSATYVRPDGIVKTWDFTKVGTCDPNFPLIDDTGWYLDALQQRRIYMPDLKPTWIPLENGYGYKLDPYCYGKFEDWEIIESIKAMDPKLSYPGKYVLTSKVPYDDEKTWSGIDLEYAANYISGGTWLALYEYDSSQVTNAEKQKEYDAYMSWFQWMRYSMFGCDWRPEDVFRNATRVGNLWISTPYDAPYAIDMGNGIWIRGDHDFWDNYEEEDDIDWFAVFEEELGSE